jgi:hypothetical protein
MSDQQKEPIGAAIVEELGCLLIPLVMVVVFVLLTMLRFEQAKQVVQDYQKDLNTPYGHVIGKVKSVETWQAEKFVHKEGNLTLTLPITDRCKITFVDGRTKELLGMPKEAVPTDKEVAIVWARFDLLLEVVDAEEFKKREKEKKKE